MVNSYAGIKLTQNLNAGDNLAQEYDKLFKIVALVFINAMMRVLGLEPGIISMEYPEVFNQETQRGIMDFAVLTKMGYYIIFEFHSTPLSEKILLRNFQYLADFRVNVKLPVNLHILSIEKIKKSVRSVKITTDWEFRPKFTFLIDWDGDEILNSIKDKIENNKVLTDMDAYLFAVIPFTKHEMDTVELIKELCYFVNEIELTEEHKYIIKLVQILWVNALVDDEELSLELMDVIKMKSNFIRNLEKDLVESAVNSTEIRTKNEIVKNMLNENLSRETILKVTGVDVLKM